MEKKISLERMMRLSVFRKVLFFLFTGFCAFLVSIPIFERGGLELEVLDDALFIGVWIVGAFLLFTKSFSKAGQVLSLFPVLLVLSALLL
jgi:hypothetical protein